MPDQLTITKHFSNPVIGDFVKLTLLVHQAETEVIMR
jgi:hypothetical protein